MPLITPGGAVDSSEEIIAELKDWYNVTISRNNGSARRM
jgi:hypothetical protein